MQYYVVNFWGDFSYFSDTDLLEFENTSADNKKNSPDIRLYILKHKITRNLIK